MHNKIMFSILVGILVIGVTQFSFAEEAHQDTSRIAVDVEKFEQPTSKHKYQEITISGHIGDYTRGGEITIVIVEPNEHEEEMKVYASKKGHIYTFLHITHDSQIGEHEVLLKYQGEEIAHTSFEILESQ